MSSSGCSELLKEGSVKLSLTTSPLAPHQVCLSREQRYLKIYKNSIKEQYEIVVCDKKKSSPLLSSQYSTFCVIISGLVQDQKDGLFGNKKKYHRYLACITPHFTMTLYDATDDSKRSSKTLSEWNAVLEREHGKYKWHPMKLCEPARLLASMTKAPASTDVFLIFTKNHVILISPTDHTTLFAQKRHSCTSVDVSDASNRQMDCTKRVLMEFQTDTCLVECSPDQAAVMVACLSKRDLPDLVTVTPCRPQRKRLVSSGSSTSSLSSRSVNTCPSANSMERCATCPSANSMERGATCPSANSMERGATCPSANSMERGATCPSANSMERGATCHLKLPPRRFPSFTTLNEKEKTHLKNYYAVTWSQIDGSDYVNWCARNGSSPLCTDEDAIYQAVEELDDGVYILPDNASCQPPQIRDESLYHCGSEKSEMYWGICNTLHEVLNMGVPQPDTLGIPKDTRLKLAFRLMVDSDGDWQTLADNLDLTKTAADILLAFVRQHHCNLALGEIILRHWQFIYNNSIKMNKPHLCPVPCTKEGLVSLLEKMERYDLHLVEHNHRS